MNNIQVLGRERLGYRKSAELIMILALGIMGTAAVYVADKSWGPIPFGKIALIGFGILMLIGHFSLRNKKLSKKLEGLEMKINRLSDKLSSQQRSSQ